MKMNFKSIALLVLVCLFHSCSSSDDTVVNSETELRDVFLKLSNGNVLTRGTGSHVNNSAAILNNGYIYLVKNNGVIDKTIVIKKGDSALENDTVGVKSLTENGIIIEGVAGSVNKAYFMGNVTITDIGKIKNIDEALETVIEVDSQYDENDAGVAKVSLYGESFLQPIKSEEFNYIASLQAGAISSRLEIGEIEKEKGCGIESFEIEGIFINNYYEKMTVNGKLTKEKDPKDNGQEVSNYEEKKGSYIGTNGAIFDYNAKGLSKENTQVWGYNFLVPNEDSTSPQVVIRLKNVKIKGKDTLNMPLFISIKTMYVSNPADVVKIKKGHVYHIPKVEFSEGDLNVSPFEDNKKVKVEISLIPWETEEIKVELN